MKKFFLLLAVVPVLSMAQAPESIPARKANALAQAFDDAVAWRKAGGVPVYVRPTKFVAGATLAKDGWMVRCSGYFAPTDWQFWNTPIASWTVEVTDPATGQTTRQPTSWLGYAIVEVAADTEVDATSSTWAAQAIPGTCSDLLPAPAGSWQVTVKTFSDPEAQATTTGWTSACATGPGCQYVLPGTAGPAVACPRDVTMTPGSFSGADVVYKTAGEWAGISSWPDACR